MSARREGHARRRTTLTRTPSGHPLNSRRIIGGLALAALATVLVSAVMALLTDGPGMLAALRGFPLLGLAAMLALGLASFAVRGLRWGQLMRVVGHPTRARDAIYLQLAGQTMTLTPGRVGEVLKPWLARSTSGMPMTRGVALVFAERVADLIGVCILALGGLSLVGGNRWMLMGGLAAVLVGSALASSEWFRSLALRVVKRQDWAREHHASAETISETIRLSLTWRTLMWSVPASVLAWGLEGVGFALCLSALGFSVLNLPSAVSIYAIATVAGALTFLPGGIGLTEASMAGILIAAGMNPADASAATVITRLATLWWGVGIGWVVLTTRPSVLRSVLATGDADTLVGDSSSDSS